MIGTGADVRKKSRRLRIMLLKVASVFVIGLAGNSALSQQLKMKITGDTATGCSGDIFDGSQLLLHNTGEFSLRLANLDLSETADIKAWRASGWVGDEKKLRLTGETYLSEFDLGLSIAMTYEIVNENVIKKSVELFQSGMPSLFYAIDFVEKPAVAPLKYITFENRGGVEQDAGGLKR
jgi:hypothetical protein